MNKNVRFGDVVKRVNQFVDKDNTDILYYVGKGGSIEPDAFDVEPQALIEGATIGYKFHFGFEPGHILFMSRCFDQHKAATATFRGICSDSTYVVETRDTNVLTQEYLQIVMQSPKFWQWLDEHKTGGVNFLINYKTLEDYEFDLPPLSEQNEIASRIWSAYRLKKKYRQLIAATDELVKSQFIEMFGETNKVSINTLVDTIWGSSPDSKTYNEIGDGVPFYQGKTEFGDVYINPPITFCTEPIRMAKKNAILMSVRAPVGAVNIATQDCCIGRGLASITPKIGKATTMFVFYALRYMEDELDRLGTGSTFKAINKESYAKVLIPEANIEKQDRFVSIAEQADKSKFELKKSIEKIDNVIKALMQ